MGRLKCLSCLLTLQYNRKILNHIHSEPELGSYQISQTCYWHPETKIIHRSENKNVHVLLLTSYISVFVGLVIMNFLALFYLLIFNENNILIT